jgi:type IV pilus assembly protein PilO
MTLQELNELDFSQFGDWPPVMKAVLAAMGCLLLLGVWYYFDTQDQFQRLSQADAQEQALRAEFEQKQRKAANLSAYEEQLAVMQESFGAMLSQLPDKTEVAALLVDVSQAGLAAGLEFELFQPTGELPRDFYAELPIKIRVTGRYHEFGRFISGLASLPRIVTIHDVAVSPAAKQQRQETPAETELELQATVKTYRYLDDSLVGEEQS